MTHHPTVKLFAGSFDDIPVLLAAMQRRITAFLNVTPVFNDPAGEAHHARNLVDACSEVGSIKHIMFSSSGAMSTPKHLLEKLWGEYVPENLDGWMTTYMKSETACEEAGMGSELEDM